MRPLQDGASVVPAQPAGSAKYAWIQPQRLARRREVDGVPAVQPALQLPASGSPRDYGAASCSRTGHAAGELSPGAAWCKCFS